jgi:hypothetical protein
MEPRHGSVQYVLDVVYKHRPSRLPVPPPVAARTHQESRARVDYHLGHNPTVVSGYNLELGPRPAAYATVSVTTLGDIP